MSRENSCKICHEEFPSSIGLQEHRCLKANTIPGPISTSADALADALRRYRRQDESFSLPPGFEKALLESFRDFIRNKTCPVVYLFEVGPEVIRDMKTDPAAVEVVFRNAMESVAALVEAFDLSKTKKESL